MQWVIVSLISGCVLHEVLLKKVLKSLQLRQLSQPLVHSIVNVILNFSFLFYSYVGVWVCLYKSPGFGGFSALCCA